ncbi:MAG: efflux RND transporter periplasmic adaptor subunit [Phycisphaerales bacterium]|nr:efflux RND transporter periplasmic adaptor subunit [Phycisphaerales bacterium]
MRKVIAILGWVVGAGVVLALIVGGAAVFIVPKVLDAQRASKDRARQQMVDVAEVTIGELTRTISAPGTVKPKTEVNITSRVSAKLVRLAVQDGDTVREGDIVAELDRKELEARLAAAEARMLADQASLKASEASLASDEAGLLGVKASLDKATADFERTQELFKSGDKSESELDAIKAELERQRSTHAARLASLEGTRASVEAARARVAVAQADVDQAKENLDYTIIRSPMIGVVTQVNSEIGEVVLGTIQNQGTVIMTIADLSEMLVEAELSEFDAPKAKEGQHVRVYVQPYGDQRFAGELRRVGLQSRMNQQDGAKYFDAEVVLDTAGEQMFSGLTASVDIEIETLRDVIVVPSQAVIDKKYEELPRKIQKDELIDKEKSYARVVFVLDGDKVHMQPVKVSASDLKSTAILAGLETGQQVVIGPFKALLGLRDGATVKVRSDQDEAGDAEGGDDVVVHMGGRRRR